MGSILVVDDDASIREGLREVLEDAGHDVLEARNGREALAILRTAVQRTCLVLLDLMMPVFDGFQFRREQLADPAISQIPVIVLSADSNLDDKADQLGDATCLRKPIGLDQLLETVARYCPPDAPPP